LLGGLTIENEANHAESQATLLDPKGR
jgi:hypothetical protein